MFNAKHIAVLVVSIMAVITSVAGAAPSNAPVAGATAASPVLGLSAVAGATSHPSASHGSSHWQSAAQGVDIDIDIPETEDSGGPMDPGPATPAPEEPDTRECLPEEPAPNECLPDPRD
jgi:hypothetical protein